MSVKVGDYIIRYPMMSAFKGLLVLKITRISPFVSGEILLDTTKYQYWAHTRCRWEMPSYVVNEEIGTRTFPISKELAESEFFKLIKDLTNLTNVL